MIEAQIEQRVVELAPRANDPRARAGASELLGRLWLTDPGPRTVSVARARGSMTSDTCSYSAPPPAVRFGSSGASATGFIGKRLLRATSSRRRADSTAAAKSFRPGASSTSPHSTARLPANALGGRREDVGEIAPDLALVDQAREPAGAREHAEQRRLRQAHRGRAVVAQDDLVARERELVAAARGRAGKRGERRDTALGARLLEVKARLVRELAEVHLEAVGATAQHVDVRARAEDALFGAREDDGLHLGVLEANAQERVGELDVDAEVVRVELERVPGPQPLALAHVEDETRDGAAVLRGQLDAPMAVPVGVRLEADGGQLATGVVRHADCFVHPTKR